ncbi:MAG: ABC-type transport auxiliary lipoprotein family protein [Burkholderiaceae bacterium]
MNLRRSIPPAGGRAARPRLAPLLASLAFAAGCSTPLDHYHTLRPSGSAKPGGAHAAAHGLAIGPVTVPDALARHEWVIRNGDTGAMVYEHQLWTQDLGAELAQTLVDYLNGGALPGGLWADAGPTGSGSGTDFDRPPPLRLRVQVLRFDSMLVPSPAVSDQFRWAVECVPSDPKVSPVDAGRYRVVRAAVRDVGASAGPAEGERRYDALARAHSDGVRALADDIAAALRDSAADRARECLD